MGWITPLRSSRNGKAVQRSLQGGNYRISSERGLGHKQYNSDSPNQCDSVMSNLVTLGWHKRGAIAGRGVLIDYVAYAERHHIDYSAVKHHAISHLDIARAAKEQGVTFKQGDILLVRSGLVKWYNDCASLVDRDGYFTDPNKEGVGVAPTAETVAWVWNQHFSAVAGDALAWEPVPYPADKPGMLLLLLFNASSPY